MKHYPYRTLTVKALGDLHTPVSLYLKLRDIYPESALLESSDFNAGENSLSYIAICPLARIAVNGGKAVASYPDGSNDERPVASAVDCCDAIDAFLGSFDIGGEGGEACGLFGYTAFDAVRYFESIPVVEDHQAENDAPDILYILYRYILLFDHFRNELTITEMLAPGEESGLDGINALIGNRNYASYNFRAVGGETSTITDDEYLSMVARGVERCMRGDVFQIVLSRRFEQAFKGDDFKVYRALRSINPSAYLFYFDFGGFRIFGSSPETHCKITNGHASIDPIAGTAFRSGSLEVDRKRTENLIADPKENAEHVMLVDLARNDLSRNAHNVKVDFYKQVRYYSHVIHLVSRVSGDLDRPDNAIGAYIDTFPAGTLSGAPKVRAMQLITEIEKHNRGAYGGCIGFIGFNGNLNQAITIRSFVSRGNILYYQAGAGIVSKSDDRRELQEVNSKLSALKSAIDMAEKIIN
ncbi:MAG: anthranilate synthase component I family protein [Tannerellaceae bacterium]|jgi:anthranilate synthase component 1|nr:anthranilate synthase component I family protein [Tannerellaceae bacterium]